MNDTVQSFLCRLHPSGNVFQFVLFSTLYFLLSITTVFGNVVILVALYKESSLHLPSKLLYSSLAVSDLLMGLISGTASTVFFLSLGIQMDYWKSICVYSTAIARGSFAVFASLSLLTITAISLDRLFALLLGLRYKKIVTLRRVQVLVVCFWIPGITFAIMLFLKYTIAKNYGYALNSFCLLISAVCYSKIFRALRNHQIQVRAQEHLQQGNSNEGTTLNVERYKRTVSSVICVLSVLLVCYLPYVIVTAIVVNFGVFPFFQVILGSTATLVCLNSSLNPFLYCWKIKEVREAVKITIRQALCCRH